MRESHNSEQNHLQKGKTLTSQQKTTKNTKNKSIENHQRISTVTNQQKTISTYKKQYPLNRKPSTYTKTVSTQQKTIYIHQTKQQLHSQPPAKLYIFHLQEPATTQHGGESNVKN